MRVLITGANGFVGSTLARRLFARGDQVRCLVRPGSDLQLLLGLPVEKVQGDVTDPRGLAEALEGVEVVFHLAGIRRAPAREDFVRVNAEGTRNLCQAMVESRSGARLILCSSLAAVGPSRDFPEEDAPLRPRCWYGESKAEAERIALGYADRLPVVVARPSRILGPGDRENLVFFKMAARGLRLAIGGGPRPMSTIDVEDVIDGLLLLAERPEAPGQAFFISRDTTTLEGLQDEVFKLLARRGFAVHLPAPVLRALAAGADLASSVTGRHLPLNRKLAQQLLAPGWTCSTAKASKLLGFAPRIPIADSVARSGLWYIEQHWLELDSAPVAGLR